MKNKSKIKAKGNRITWWPCFVNNGFFMKQIPFLLLSVVPFPLSPPAWPFLANVIIHRVICLVSTLGQGPCHLSGLHSTMHLQKTVSVLAHTHSHSMKSKALFFSESITGSFWVQTSSNSWPWAFEKCFQMGLSWAVWKNRCKQMKVQHSF